jgi:hypothetical protein
MTAEPPKRRFFAIDARIWAKATALGMNEAVAYLVLACGTGHSNKATSWSTNVVMRYAGVGWARAKPAIVKLVEGGFIHRAESFTETYPRYELASYRELVDHGAAKNPPAAPDYLEGELLADLRAGKQPAQKTGRKRAERLLRRGLVSKDAQGIYKLPEPAEKDSGDYFIWLPNSIVMGTLSGEESPAQRLRSAGCIWTLRLYVDLYTAQNLRDDGGVNPCLIRQRFERKKIGEQGAYVIWGFKTPDKSWGTLWHVGPFVDHEFRERKPGGVSPTWDSVRLLESMGLLSFVPHIFENDTDVAEPIHPYGIGETAEAPIEREIGDAADLAARTMALPSKLEEAEGQGFQYFCPVLKSKPSAQMIGVARLSYRPHTRRTQAWFAELHQVSQGWIEVFGKLAAKGEKASFQRTANYA